MNIEQWGSESADEGEVSDDAIVSEGTGEDPHSGKQFLEAHDNDADAAIRKEFGVDPADKLAMLAKFRELSRKTDTLGAAQLHNLYREWEEQSR